MVVLLSMTVSKHGGAGRERELPQGNPPLTLLRTRKLRPTAATILGPQGPGKIARRQIQYKTKASAIKLGRLCSFKKHEQCV